MVPGPPESGTALTRRWVAGAHRSGGGNSRRPRALTPFAAGGAASSAPARLPALQGTRDWGRCAYVGEGGTVDFEVSKYLIHKQITLYGSWVTSLKHLEELVERLDRWGLHPDCTCTVRLPLAEAAEAYELAAGGQSGKVCIVFDE